MNSSKWIKQKDDDHNSIAVMQNLMHHLSVEVSPQVVEDVLNENPHYPSLAALSDGLNDWRVENLAVRLDPDDLKEVDFPVVAHLQPAPKTPEELEAEQQAGASCGIGDEKENPHFVMLANVNDTTAEYIDTELGWVKEPKESFLRKWSGITLLVAKNSKSGDPDFKEKLKKEKRDRLKMPSIFAGIGILILTLIISGIIISPNVINWLPLFLVKIVGVTLSVLLLIELVDKKNTIVNKVCSLGQGKGKPEGNKGVSNCGEGVLDSKAAMLFGWLSMSEVGAFYFLGTVLAIVFGLFASSLSPVLYVLSILTIVALPYTIFSIYYQAVKAKQWCRLCVGVQVVLWLELIASFPTLMNGYQPIDFTAITILAWAFLLPIIAWVVFKPGLGMEDKVKELKKQLNAYRRNPAIIKDQLTKGRQFDMGLMPQEVILGNPEANFTVTIFSNPFCGPCRNAHKELDRLLDEFGDGVRVVFRFNYQGTGDSVEEQFTELKRVFAEEIEDEDDMVSMKGYYGETPEDWKATLIKAKEDAAQKNSVALTLLALAQLGQTEKLHTAMSEWYNGEDQSDEAIDAWRKKFPVPSALIGDMEPALQASGKWASDTDIEGTPTLFINDREFVNGVQYVGDLKYYIRAMEEQLEEEMANQQVEASHDLPVIQPTV